jgi:hypothetical protein
LNHEDTKVRRFTKIREQFSNKFPKLDVSLSKELDSITNMKLYKVHTVSFPKFIKDFNVTVDQFVLGNELREIPITNKKEIMKYFNEL